MVANLKKFQLMFLVIKDNIEGEMYFEKYKISEYDWVIRYYIRQKYEL